MNTDQIRRILETLRAADDTEQVLDTEDREVLEQMIQAVTRPEAEYIPGTQPDPTQEDDE